MTDKVAKLVIGDQTHEFPILSGSVGPDVMDIRSLYAKTGLFTYDPGFTSTAACDSAITYIDGDKGELLYRGYPIEQLAEKSNYLEVCYLLLYGELPTQAQLTEFDELVTRHTMVHEQMHYFYRGFRRDAHPMAIMTGVVGAIRAASHTESPTAIAMIGFSGPRLTPPARPRMSVMATPGSAMSLSGFDTSSVAAGSGPAWPGASHTVTPTAMPVSVRIAMIQKRPSPSTPSASGSVSHNVCSSPCAIQFTLAMSRPESTPITRAGTVSLTRLRTEGPC